jgi:hypothetical protein
VVPVVVRESQDPLRVLFLEDSVIKLLSGAVFFGSDPIMEYSIAVFSEAPFSLEQFEKEKVGTVMSIVLGTDSTVVVASWQTQTWEGVLIVLQWGQSFVSHLHQVYSTTALKGPQGHCQRNVW